MAARGMSAGMLAAIVAGHLRPAIFYEGTFLDSGGAETYLRLWTGLGPKDWDGKTWTGGGQLLGVSPIVESSSLKAVGFEISVSGVKVANIAIATESAQRSRFQAGRVWLALYDAAGAVVADPYLLKRGKFDLIPIRESGDTCTITAKYEDRLNDLQTPNERRWTHDDQQLRSPGDRGFEYVESLQDATFRVS